MRVVAVLLVFFVVLIHAAKIRRFLHIDRLEVCNKSANMPQEIFDLHAVNQRRGNVNVSFKVIVKSDQRKSSRVEVVVTRCINKEALDTCEHFTTLRPLASCQLLTMPNTPWASMYHNAQPPLSCPFKKGEYKLTSNVDPELFAVFSLDSYYWRIKAIIYDQDVLGEFGAICADAYIIKI